MSACLSVCVYNTVSQTIIILYVSKLFIRIKHFKHKIISNKYSIRLYSIILGNWIILSFPPLV